MADASTMLNFDVGRPQELIYISIILYKYDRWIEQMPATKKASYARYTLAAVSLLGRLIQIERKNRRMTAQELAERLGISRGTVQRLERGDPKVETGLAFEACTILGIPLFEDSLNRLSARLDEAGTRLTLLPKYARPIEQAMVDDDF